MTQQADTSAKVIGQVLFIFSRNMKASELQALLNKYNIREPNPTKWYFVNDILNLFQDIISQPEAMYNLVSIGMAVAEYALLPAEFTNMTADSFFLNVNQVYQMQHKGNVGELTTLKIGDGHYKIEIVSPYPDDFWYGIMYGWAKRYVPVESQFTVRYDNAIIRRDLGGEKTVVEIEWQRI